MGKNLYTLRTAMNDDVHSKLNGKMFWVNVNNENQHARFIDVITGLVLVESTSVESRVEGIEGIIIRTSSGTEYDLVFVETLIPTYKKNEFPKVVKMEHIHRQINYCDGYDGTIYTFESAIDVDTFISFLNKEGMELRYLTGAAWYQDHAAIECPAKRFSYDGTNNCESSTWVYKWVRAYTD